MLKTHNTLKLGAFLGVLSFAMTVSCSQEKQDTKPKQDYQQLSSAGSVIDNTPLPQKEGARVDATKVVEKIICPEYAELSKKGLFWGAPDGWRSYSQSFVGEVVSFVEAQWHGVNVGKMMCVYVGKVSRQFPVVLQNDMLTKMPTGLKWGGLKNGVVKCKSTNINDCPFFHTKRDVDVEKAYDELDFKKSKGDDDLD